MTAWVQFFEGTAALFAAAYVYAKGLNAASSWLDRRRR